jgi:hypothetical protein
MISLPSQVYPLTDSVQIHDTRGQREFTEAETEQLKLILDGAAVANTVVKQRKRYWLLLNEFWKSEEDMTKCFDSEVRGF